MDEPEAVAVPLYVGVRIVEFDHADRKIWMGSLKLIELQVVADLAATPRKTGIGYEGEQVWRFAGTHREVYAAGLIGLGRRAPCLGTRLAASSDNPARRNGRSPASIRRATSAARSGNRRDPGRTTCRHAPPWWNGPTRRW